MPWALLLALASAGRSMPAKIAMIAITTSNSISVKPLLSRELEADELFIRPALLGSPAR